MIKCNRCGSDDAYIKLVILPELAGWDSSYDYCSACYDWFTMILAMFNSNGALAITDYDMAMQQGDRES